MISIKLYVIVIFDVRRVFFVSCLSCLSSLVPCCSFASSLSLLFWISGLSCFDKFVKWSEMIDIWSTGWQELRKAGKAICQKNWT